MPIKNMNKYSSMDMMNDQKFVGAKQLSIAWVENNSYWRWSRIEETSSNTGLDVAELIKVCWLDLRGKFEITKLSLAKTTYEVVFVVKLEQASRWEVPVNFTLILPDGSKQERKENLEEKPKGEWIEIPIGDFVASPERTGEIEFAIYEHGDDHWKGGLVIKGIAIRPKYQNDWFVNAKKLSIAWAENNSYWRWSETSSNTAIDVAELIEVCWLDVRGKFEITKPSPDINTYEVAFVIKLEEQASGWEVPVNLTLILPDGNKQKRRENLVGKPRGEWIEIQVGEFVASPERTGEIEFAIYEHGDDHWKKGLAIKGVAIRPKYQNDQFVDAKNLSIAWVENNRYWRWSKIEETNSETAIDVAELIEVCWLDVRGKFEITKPSLAKTTYEVAFVVKLKEQASGWEVPVNVTLIQPHGNKQERKENLVGKPKGEWIEIPVGEFVASPKRTGEIEFAIYEHGDDLWKRGLVIKGIAIRPKYQNDWFVVAKNLSIAWAENNRYWRWSKIEETSCNTVIDVAELIDVCWLDVRGKFEIAKLSRARTTYEVAFVIKLEEQVSQWKVPVNVTLILPDGNKQERKENLEGKPKGEWIEIPVGEFVASPEKTGEIEFAIYEHGDDRWKKGLIIKGIAIRPKFQNDWFVVAKNLSIAWAENNNYWRWSKIEETSSYTNTGFDVAQLIEVCWLDVRGKFEITKLSRARTTYEIAFVIKLEEHASGWEVPVNVTLILPDGEKQERKENLKGKPKGDWIEILAGEFTASPGKTGEIEFAIYEHSDDRWKKGLVIKGISIRPKYQNYWFVIAKNLSITWAENNRYWRWSKIEETSSNTAVDVAELIEVCWLDVRGKFDITRLSRAITTYEVAFVIKLEEQASGWEVPVNVILILPDGNKQERKENLVGKPRGEWIEIPIGEFVASPERTGNIEFAIYEHSDDHWKKGLAIKGIAIRPKYQVDQE